MAVWTVTGFQRTAVMMRVAADSKEDAIEKARAGDYDHADTEPDGWLYRPKWTAQEGNHITRYRP